MTPIERAPRVMQSMDRLLASAKESGREPQHWIIPKDDWLAIGSALRDNLLADPGAVGANTYKEVPVHFGQVSENQLAALRDRAGERADG